MGCKQLNFFIVLFSLSHIKRNKLTLLSKHYVAAANARPPRNAPVEEY